MAFIPSAKFSDKRAVSADQLNLVKIKCIDRALFLRGQIMIKSILSFLVFASSSAFACDPEAQFIGNVSEYDHATCTYRIRYTFFHHSTLCPLDRAEASTWTFEDNTCSLKEGDRISGYLVKEGDFIRITD